LNRGTIALDRDDANGINRTVLGRFAHGIVHGFAVRHVRDTIEREDNPINKDY